MKLRQLFDGSEDERGVSPVIGVILMVAITVILAAVIGTFVLGLGDNVNQNASAGISYDANTNTVTVTSLGPNTNTVKCSSGGGTTSSVGGTFSCSDGNSVIAVTSDNEETVIRTNLPT